MRCSILGAVTVLSAALGITACGGGSPAPASATSQPDPESVFGPLDVGADYRTAYVKLNRAPWTSKTHGGRWVNVYANAEAAPVYRARGTDYPVGSVIVKESFEDRGGRPGEPGPIFVMEKRSAGYSPDHGDWWYAIHWAQPVGPRAGAEGPIYWRGRSPRANYCWECHDTYDAAMGGIPAGNRAY